MTGERLNSAEISNIIKRRIKSYGDEIKPETPLNQYLTRYACIQLLRDLHAELFPHVPAPPEPASSTLWAAHNPTATPPAEDDLRRLARTLLDADINEYKRLADSHFTLGDTLTGRGYEVAGAVVRKLRRKLFAPSVPAEAEDLAGTIRGVQPAPGLVDDGFRSKVRTVLDDKIVGYRRASADYAKSGDEHWQQEYLLYVRVVEHIRAELFPGVDGPYDQHLAVHGFRNHGPIPVPTAELPDALRKAAAAPGEWDLRPLLLDAANHLEDQGSQLVNWELFDVQLTETAQDFGTPWEELEPCERLDGIRSKAEELAALSAGIGGIAKLLGIEPDADTTALELATHLQEVVKERLVQVAGDSRIRIVGMKSDPSPAPIPPGPSADPAAAVVRILGMIEARRGAIRSGCPPYRDTSSALDALYGLQDEIGREFKIPMPDANLVPGASAPPVPCDGLRRLGGLLGIGGPASPDLVQRIEVRAIEIMAANDKYAEDHQAFRALREAVQRLAERFDAPLGHEYVKFLDSIKEPGTTVAKPVFDLLRHLVRQRAFSLRTFGPSYHWSRIVAHVRKELAEIEADPEDWMEWIDIILLGFDALLRTDMSGEEICSALMRKQEENEARTWPDWRTTFPTDAPIEHVRPSAPSINIKDIEANLIKASEPPPSKSVGDVRSLPDAMRRAEAEITEWSAAGWHIPTLLRQGADELAAHMEFRRRVMREIERVAGLVDVPPRPDALAMLEGIAGALVQPPPSLAGKIVEAGKRLGVDSADAPEAVLDRIEAVAGIGRKLGPAPGLVKVTTKDGWEHAVRIEDIRGYRSDADGFALKLGHVGALALSESSGCQVADFLGAWAWDLTDGEL